MTDLSGCLGSPLTQYSTGKLPEKERAEDCPSINDDPRHRVHFRLTDHTDCAYVQHIGSGERQNRNFKRSFWTLFRDRGPRTLAFW
jgi:hypothetical protein